MRVEEILDRLRQEGDLDADALWRDYRARVDEPTGRGFAEDLYERDIIDAPTLGDLLTSDDVEVTRVVERDFDVGRALGLETVVADEAEADDTTPATAIVDGSDRAGDGMRAPGRSGDGVADADRQAEATVDADRSVETAADADRQGEATAPARRQGGPAGSGLAERIGYRLLGALGEGSMGTVHLARDLALRRQVAFKRTKDETSRDRSALNRFFTEAQITSQLEHPHIVPVYGLEVDADGSLAYAMKLVLGKELRELVEETRELYRRGEAIDEDHALEERLDVLLKVCDAIAFAHSKGVIHRDLKPSNIMIGRYREVYVMDWGIARIMGGAGDAIDAGVELVAPDGSPTATDRTRAGTTVGTPVYMSPEQASGKNSDLDGRSDLYTLGLILQEVVTLERAIEGDSVTQAMMHARAGERRPVRHLRPSVAVPRELEAVIDKATRVDPAERYESVEALADDLRRYLRGDAVRARPDTPLQKVGRWITQHRTATLGIIATALAIVLGAAATIGTLVHEQRQLAAAQARERQLGAFLTEVSTRSHHIDTEFQRYEAELENLLGGVDAVLTHAGPSDLEIHFPEDFSGGGTPPEDLSESPYYDTSISVGFPVFVVPPGVDRDAVMPDLRRLAWLGSELRELLVASAGDGPRALSPAEQRELLAEEGAPVHRAFVSLDAGAHVAFPGMGAGPEDEDPRTQPYYTLAEGERDEVWGDPYVDDYGRLVLACSRALYDRQDRFLGVAGFEMTLDYIFDEHLALADLGYVREELLVDDDGSVMVEETVDAPGGARTPSEEYGVEMLRHPEVVEAFGDGTAGYLEIEDGERDLLVAYYPIESIGAYYVVVADAAGMLAEDG